jgi:uncharacterized membrane protein YkvA (DUF1232 family)
MKPGFSAFFLCTLVLGASVSAAVPGANAQENLPLDQRLTLAVPLVQADDIDRPTVDGFVRGISTGLRQTFRRALSTVKVAIKAWTRYARRAARWIALALLVGILDRNLIAAWRVSGLRVLTTYIPLMLYVNLRLFFDRRVFWLGKVLLVSAIAYGIWRHDFIPDRAPLPGYIEDMALVILATRLLMAWSGDDVVFEHASAAVQRWGRMVALRGSRAASE